MNFYVDDCNHSVKNRLGNSSDGQVVRVARRWGDRPMRLTSTFCACLLLVLCGCSPGLVGQPDFDVRVMLPPDAVASLDSAKAYSDGTLIPFSYPTNWTPLQACTAAYGKDPTNNTPKTPTETDRNNCVKEIMLLIDTQYDAYERSLLGVVNDYDLSSDIAALGLTTASSLVGGKTTKTILSATAAAVIGAKSYVSTDLLYNLTVQVIINQMNTDRATTHCTILTKLKNPMPPATGTPAPQTLTLTVTPDTNTTITVPPGGTPTAAPKTVTLTTKPTPAQTYSMLDAASDLIQYYKDGTIRNAMTSLQAKTGSQSTSAKTKLTNTQTTGSPTGSGSTTTGSTGGSSSTNPPDSTGCSAS